MPNAERLVLSLTGPDSHTIELAPGQGNLVIGPSTGDGGRPDAIVDPRDRIDWSVFDHFTGPVGHPWPRYFTYRGDDTGFLEWARTRRIERFDWAPMTAAAVDAGQAKISVFTIRLGTAPVEVAVPRSPDGRHEFAVAGDLSLLSAITSKTSSDPGSGSVAFSPTIRPGLAGEPLRLPDFPALAAATNVSVSCASLRQAFDCAGLAQFAGARSVSLSGRLVNLEALALLGNLESLRLSDSPDLSSFPALEEFPNLHQFMAWNEEEEAGKRLRSELRGLTKSSGRTWEHSGVSQLRAPAWFVTEYGLPFSEWPAKTGRFATKTYRAAALGIKNAKSVAETAEVVRDFVRAFNTRPGIDTIEREDLGEAVALLVDGEPFGVTEELALSWFDEERDY
ncbi:hypothetical protein [Amycolatopsis sp. BJA-103]|uniref:hypothetical protein n=1 Tax=Amycolatopsis sp. BJA-103 TaxID=1911175 RepID=UPI000C78930E|nr:hypothetical protein [Amycolatopsis sp. BJA-103]